MAFEEDKQATKDKLLAPTDKRVDKYRNCPIEWKAALTNEQWNPNPYEIRPTVPAPGELHFLEEREAFLRAQFATFLHIPHTDNMGLWFQFPELLLAKIRCGEETRTNVRFGKNLSPYGTFIKLQPRWGNPSNLGFQRKRFLLLQSFRADRLPCKGVKTERVSRSGPFGEGERSG